MPKLPKAIPEIAYEEELKRRREHARRQAWATTGWGGVGVRGCASCETEFEGAAWVIDGFFGREYFCRTCIGRYRVVVFRPEPCLVCGRSFAWVGGQMATPPVGFRDRPRPRVHLCSDSCRREHRNRARRRLPHERRRCLGCPRSFVPTRDDQRYHSHACRQRAYRRRQREVAPGVAGASGSVSTTT